MSRTHRILPSYGNIIDASTSNIGLVTNRNSEIFSRAVDHLRSIDNESYSDERIELQPS